MTALSDLQLVIAGASAITAHRMYRFDLHRRYPALFFYMAFTALNSLSPIVWDIRGHIYYLAWLCTQPLQWLLDVLLVGELCRVVLERYPSLLTLGRWAIHLGIGLSVFLSFLSFLPHTGSNIPARSKLLGYFMATDRGINLSLAIFLLLMLFAVSRFPMRLSRNAILNAALFTASFLCTCLGLLLQTVFDLRMNQAVNVVLAVINGVCALVWMRYLNSEGEQIRFDWIRFRPEYEERVLSRLDILNGIMQRLDRTRIAGRLEEAHRSYLG